MRRGGAPRTTERMHRIETRHAPAIYVLLMGACVSGFTVVDGALPPLVTFAILVAAGAVQVGAGYALGRSEALALALAPVLVALAAAGRDSSLWVTVLILMVFPGAPLIAAGVWLRRSLAERADDSPDSWLYGEPPR
jgi:hypothetical protein